MNWFLLIGLLARAPVAPAVPAPAPVEAPASASASSQGAPQQVSIQASKVWLTGTSNLHDWSCKVLNPQPVIVASPSSDPPGLLPTSVVFKIPVLSINCGNGHMEEKLQEALAAKQHPHIEFNLTSAQGLSAGDKVIAKGTLHIAAVTKNIGFVAHLSKQGDHVEVTGDVPVEMPDYGVEPPTAMLGMLQTGAQVVVHFALTLAPQAR